MAEYLASPQAFIEIYPYEGGIYELTGGSTGILSVMTEKDIWGQRPGRFEIHLAPGGPNGVNSMVSWTKIITPLSLVVIWMARAGRNFSPMIGVVRHCFESTTWHQDPKSGAKQVRRSIFIAGEDFQYFFNSYNFYNLTFLGINSMEIEGKTFSLSKIMNDSLSSGRPDQIGAEWYNSMMVGEQGLLGQTSVIYKKVKVHLRDLIKYRFDEYPTNIYIPLNINYLSSDENWFAKFKNIFPFPFYETFVTTAPYYFYEPMNELATTHKTLDKVGFTASAPCLVARVNPLPSITVDNGIAIDTSLWSELETYDLTDSGYIDSHIGFDVDEIRNFYILTPVIYGQAIGKDNSNILPSVYLFGIWYNAYSLHRYGYHPHVMDTCWFSDMSIDGKMAQMNKGKDLDMTEFIKNLSYKMTGFFEPAPLMASGRVTTILRPDIFPGTRFEYSPFKNTSDVWQFYITGVTHKYVFGRQSTTTVNLARGLPKAVYEDPVLLKNIHLGNAQRLDGEYISGLPNDDDGNPQIGLTPFDLCSIDTGAADMAKIFSLAGGK